MFPAERNQQLRQRFDSFPPLLILGQLFLLTPVNSSQFLEPLEEDQNIDSFWLKPPRLFHILHFEFENHLQISCMQNILHLISAALVDRSVFEEQTFFLRIPHIVWIFSNENGSILQKKEIRNGNDSEAMAEGCQK